MDMDTDMDTNPDLSRLSNSARAPLARLVDAEVRAMRRRIRIQKVVGWLVFVPFGWPLILFMRYGLGYRVESLASCRRIYDEALAEGKPLLVCSNHLTYIDPVILIYAFSHHLRYVFRYRALCWNLAASEYSGNAFFALIGICFKVLFIHRKGDLKGGKAHNEMIYQIASELLGNRETLNLFPEGRRSRSGRFDDSKLAYGVGKIAARLNEVNVLCCYLRADGQEGHSGFPKRGARFRLTMERVAFRPADQSRETVESITRTVAQTIQKLESQRLAGAQA
jgi:1-acyl-sn-glycerol-3-phosphate acyltransferase